MTTQEYSTSTFSATTPVTDADRRKLFNDSNRRKRRDIARDVWAAYRAVCTAAGFFPAEIRTAEAITLCHYEVAGQDYDKPRAIKLALIGDLLCSFSDTDKGKENTGSNRASQLFTEAQPRTGYQLHTRYKALVEKRAHEYVDHVTPVAEMVAELHATEKAAILKDGQKQKQARIAEALKRIAADVVSRGYLPACDAELVNEDGEVYAYLSDAEARTYSAKNPNLKAQARTTRPKRPLVREDFDRIEEKLRGWIADELEDALKRNSFDEARWFAARLEASLPKQIRSWVKAAGIPDTGQERESTGITYVSAVGVSEVVQTPEPDAENGADVEELEPQELGYQPGLSPLDTRPEKNLCDFGERQNGAGDLATETPSAPVSPSLPEGSENFDTSLEAAMSYVRDGWAIVPCRDKKPLVGGKIKNAGHTAASRDKGLITEWFTETFPGAGLAIRLDGHVLIDVDVKDGAPGLESFDTLASTFDLPATLTQVTPSGGRHYIFSLPDSLPAGYLGNWTKFLEAEGLGGIDIKTGVGGLCHVEPTRTAKGVYRWIDPTADIAELPRDVCDFFHEVHEREQQAKIKPQASTTYTSSDAGPFDPNEDQGKYFKDAPNGQRRPRLRSVACAVAKRGANAGQIVDVLKYHDGRFTEPTNDVGFMLHVAEGAVSKFGQGVTA